MKFLQKQKKKKKKKERKKENKRERQNVPIKPLFPNPVLCLDFRDVTGAPLPDKGNCCRALLKCDSFVCFAIPSMLYYYVHYICAHGGPIWLIAFIKYLSSYQKYL